MPTDEYTNAAGGGLRLKGITGAKVTKRKKKRPKHPETEERSSSAKPKPDAEASGIEEQAQDGDEALNRIPQPGDATDNREGSEDRSQPRGKTEAELRHEERRRRRVCLTFIRLTRPYIQRC